MSTSPPSDKPLPSHTDGVRYRQMRALTKPVREAVITLVYVDVALGFAEAREIGTGELVSLNRHTSGVDFNCLNMGTQYIASITRFHHATKVVATSQ